MSTLGKTVGRHQGRFHGAFTGGLSAGFYNSVGSAEGWNPSSYSSSRDKRAAPREQRPEDFMDEEDGLLTEQLQAKPEFDTLGITASEIVNRHAEREATGGIIPGPAPSELIAPVGDPMGKKLLKTMGWREGQGVGSRVKQRRLQHVQEAAGDDSPDEHLSKHVRHGLGKKARALVDTEGLTFAPDNTDVRAQIMLRKGNLHGIGYDAFKNAPEFESARAARAGSRTSPGVYRTEDILRQSERVGELSTGIAREHSAEAISLARGAHGFVLDDDEDDVYEGAASREVYDLSLDVQRAESGFDSLSESARAWARDGVDEGGKDMLTSRRCARCPSDGRLPPTGFVVAQRPDSRPRHWPPPVPPQDFNPIHKFDQMLSSPMKTKGKQRRTEEIGPSERARLLGQPIHEGTKKESMVASHSLVNDPLPNPEGSSVVSLLSPAAREKFWSTKGGLQGTSLSSCVDAASTGQDLARNSTAPSNHQLDGAGGIKFQATVGKGGTRNPLANKFTSEKSREASAHIGVSSVGIDPLARPPGLTLRTPCDTNSGPATFGASSSSRTQCEEDPAHEPSRSTLPWKPAPLLCKRLNVPVPDALAEINWIPRRVTDGTHGESASQPTKASSSTSVAPAQSQVDQLLQGIEQRHFTQLLANAVPTTSESSALDEDHSAEKPPIDLFKSIFESESESDSGNESNEDEEDKRGVAATMNGTHEVDKSTSAQSRSFGSEGSGHALRDLERASFGAKSRNRGYGSDSSEESPQHANVGSGLVRVRPNSPLDAKKGSEIERLEPELAGADSSSIHGKHSESRRESRSRHESRSHRGSRSHGGHSSSKHKKKSAKTYKKHKKRRSEK